MKPVNFHGVRGKQVLLTIIVIICTSVLVWTWTRTAMTPTLLHFNIYPTEILSGDHITEEDRDMLVSYTDEQAEKILGIDLSNEVQLPPVSEETGQIPSIDALNSTLVLSRTKQADQVPGIAPVSHVKESITEIKKDDYDDEIKKECNYANGKWVPDDRRPLYSGFHCKRWLSRMWACRLTQRPDFSYEGFRWQPENCEMPEFEPKSFLHRMKDKTIAFVGDSLGRQQFQSLMCIATGGISTPEVRDVGREFGLGKPRGAVRPPGWAYRFTPTNTTILHYWSTTLCELEPLKLSSRRTDVALHIDRPVKFLRRHLHKVDVLVLNTGHHWNRGKINANRWKIFVNGKPVTDRKLLIVSNARDFAVRSVVKWVDREIPNHHQLKVFFRTLSPRHFLNGDWNTGGSCDSTTPLAGGSQANGSYDSATKRAVKGTKVNLLDVTGLSKLRDEGHISKYSSKSSTGTYDCLHWCLPGIPDTWNEILLAQI